MKAYFRPIALSLSMMLCCYFVAEAQFVEDALRLGAPGLSVGARSLGMGTAYTGVADDFSAAYWNPAGLGQIRLNEVSFGLSNLSFGNTSKFQGSDQSTTNSSTNLNSAGLVYVVPTTRGSLVMALGYGRQSDFTTGLSFSGFNPNSSIIQSWAPDGVSYASYDLSQNNAYQLFLANKDTLSGAFESLVDDSLTQSGKVLEGGGINYYTAAGAIEAAQNVYLGATLNFISGSYTYSRSYSETDSRDIYDAARTAQFSPFPFDLNSLSVTENLETDISGFNAKLGFLYTPTPNSRVGITVKTPSWITARETFSSKASAEFDDGNLIEFPSEDVAPSKNEYDVRTPFSFSGGFSYSANAVTVAADLEYTDWTQLEFSSSGTFSTAFNDHLLKLNSQIKDVFQPSVNVRAGLEVTVPNIEMSLRGGFAYLQSPYQFDQAANAQKYITAGIGFLIDNSIAVDVGYARGYWETSHVNYTGSDSNGNSFSQGTAEKIRTNNLIATFAYRF